MQALNTTSLTLQDNRLWILDQQALPQEKRWRACDSVEELVGHIHSLRVRGAPPVSYTHLDVYKRQAISPSGAS